MPTIESIDEWLTCDISTANRGRYRHQLLQENADAWEQVADDILAYFRAAHDDAIRHIRDLAGASLDPPGLTRAAGPEVTYPHGLHDLDKQGYVGEVFAAIVAEHFSPHGHEGWEVPAFLFRFHNVAFERLEAIAQTGEAARRVPGRTGDDCLAFLRDRRGRIIKVLYCEAKCTQGHRADLVIEAHGKVSTASVANALYLIEVLKDRGDPEALRWIDALQQFRLRRHDTACERCDLVCYVCGQRPRQADTWIPTARPHESYTGGRRLEAVEIHLDDVAAMVEHVYSEEAWR